MAARDKTFELWTCPDVDGIHKMQVLQKCNIVDKEHKCCQDDFVKTTKGRSHLQEVTCRLFRNWHQERAVRFADMWGNVSPKGADTHAPTIKVPLSDCRHYTVDDIKKGSI